MFTLHTLIATAQQLKAKVNYDEWLKRLAEQQQWIQAKCPTINAPIDIENIRAAMKSIKPCKNCQKKICPKKSMQYTYVGEIRWWNDRTYLRWVADCRDTQRPLPTIETFRSQIERDQQAIAEARAQFQRA